MIYDTIVHAQACGGTITACCVTKCVSLCVLRGVSNLLVGELDGPTWPELAVRTLEELLRARRVGEAGSQARRAWDELEV